MAIIEAHEAFTTPQSRSALPAPDVVPAVPVYNTKVESWQFREERIYKGIGKTTVEEWLMNDGIRYDVMLGEPEHQRTDVPVVRDTSWGTQVRGFNRRVTAELMQLGYPVVIKGPERGRPIPLSQSAHNTHEILNVSGERGFHDPNSAAVEGYSRGAMIGFGTVAYGPIHRRDIVFANWTDPCIYKRPEMTAGELLQRVINMKKLPVEAGSAVLEIGRLLLNPRKAAEFRETVDLSLEGLEQLINTGRAVFSGEAGFLAERMPADTHGTVGFFMSSLGNDEAEYRKVLGRYEKINIKPVHGGHISGIGNRILRHIVDSFYPIIE